MKKPPSQHTNTYWLSPDGQHVNGPYSMTQILAMHQVAPLAPDMPMRLEGTDSWATVADWLPIVVPQSPRARAREAATARAQNPAIPPWTLLAGLGIAVAAVLYYFFVL
ncbi:hypothetical protein DES53_104153 [Roseimicrobium gellanilyticum]|uniref:GYF domain-containing protein n=1 Tax=Roseimicrobium gellanilyticum TaxID=748857 RepID=A0A366HQ71_9BACT|nr:hypothetical protein [Roseimicrobium gellanilyticum]RBP44334.1 hypothetical protein DES53_104153 [Roseimicrobium gellanilyticum]